MHSVSEGAVCFSLLDIKEKCPQPVQIYQNGTVLENEEFCCVFSRGLVEVKYDLIEQLW